MHIVNRAKSKWNSPRNLCSFSFVKKFANVAFLKITGRLVLKKTVFLRGSCSTLNMMGLINKG